MKFDINDFNRNNRNLMLERLNALRESKNWDIKNFDTKEKIISELDRLEQARNREDMPSAYYENVDSHIESLKKELLNCTKNEIKTITESVLDPIQKYRCDSLFGPKNKEESPKMLNSAREFLINLAEKFIKDIDIPGTKIEEFFMVGSSLGYQYRENADIDCDLRINVSKKDMEGKWSFCPKGIIYPDSAHPVNIFVLCSDDKPYNFEEDCENAYDILKNKWIKQGKLSNQDPIPFEHIAGISQFIMDGITLELERARRNIDQANMYLKLDSSRFEISEKERDDALADKIADLQMDADALKLAHHFLFKLDVEGFNREDFGISIAYTAQSKHYTINNLIYKYVDRFGYYDKINETTKQIWETIDKIKSGIKSDTGNDQEKRMKTEIEKEVLKEADDVESVNDKTTVLNNLRSDIQDEYTAIKGYDAHADFAEKNNYLDIAKILRDIRDEEKVHVGELEAIVKKYDKEFKDSLADGGKEAEEILKEKYIYVKMKDYVDAYDDERSFMKNGIIYDRYHPDDFQELIVKNTEETFKIYPHMKKDFATAKVYSGLENELTDAEKRALDAYRPVYLDFADNIIAKKGNTYYWFDHEQIPDKNYKPHIIIIDKNAPLLESKILTESREYTQYVKGHIKNLKSGYRWMKKYLPELFPKGYFDKENRNIRSAVRNHDKSKWGKDEYKAYSDFQEIRKRTDLSDEEYDSMKGEFNKAWNHHQKGNKHHWQYWVLQNADGSTKVLDMPYENIIEMICDWWTFSWKDNDLKAIFEWYNKNKNNMILSPKTRSKVEEILLKMKKKIEELEKTNSLTESLNESRLPEDGSDPEYGIPELKKYPLFDKDHVISAIKLFGHVEPKYEGKLAHAIIRKMREYNIPFDMIGEDNKLYKYI